MGQAHFPRNKSYRIVEPKKDKDGIKIVLSPEGEDTFFFHVNVQLSTGIIGMSALEKEPQHALVRDIMAIDGVQHMYVDKYKVKVSRTLAVDWEDIVSKALVAIQEAAKIILAKRKEAAK